jgi:hypothetical protein
MQVSRRRVCHKRTFQELHLQKGPMKSRGRAKQGFRDYHQHQQNCMGDDLAAAAYVETQFHVPFFRNVRVV